MAEAEERMVREVEERVRREAEQEMRRQMEERERAIAEKMERWADHTHLQQLSYLAQAYVYKWKNHFYEMKGDVGMSVHAKERKQEDAYTKTQTHS